jgi:hypothetical protein
MKNYLRTPADKFFEFMRVPGNCDRVMKWGCIFGTVMASAMLLSIFGHMLIR